MKIPKIETVVIFAFLGSVLLWGYNKCSAKRAELAREQFEETDDRPDRTNATTTPVASTLVNPQTNPATYAQQPSTIVTQQPGASTAVGQTPQPTPQQYTPPAPGRTPQATPANEPSLPTPTTNNKPAAATGPKYSTLYVTIDGLKIRKEPGLKGDVVTKLELYQPVYFLNQKTEWTQEISLGKETVTDHWVKIRTHGGKEGWVFGAGVHYYKMKRKGVLE